MEYMMKMVKAYLEVAKGLHVEEMQAELKKDIKVFHADLAHLIHGSDAKNLVAASSSYNIEADLLKMEEHWDEFKHLVETTKYTVTTESTEVLNAVEYQQRVLIYDLNDFYDKWKAF